MVYARDFVVSNMETITQIGVLAGSMLFIYGFYRLMTPESWEWLNATPRLRGRMLQRERRKYVELLATDGMVSGIEDLVANGIITRAESNEIYRNLKKCFPIRDLFPSPTALKDAIKRRLQAGIHDPVSLPDRKGKKKHMFDKST